MRAILNKIDWDFPGAGNKPGSINSLHWFPGNFISQIPEALIYSLSQKGATILDPFGGSGTTALAAIALGRNVISSDRLSVSKFITEGKLNAFTDKIDPGTYTSLINDLTWDYDCVSESCGASGEGSATELSAWFSKRTLSQLRYIWNCIESARSNMRPQLMLIFSDLLFECASPGRALTSTGKRRKHHWGWIADNVKPNELLEHDAVAGFRARLERLRKITKLVASPQVTAEVLQQDARQLEINENSIDLIVTSPPYIGMIDYTHANRLLYLWMGWSINEERTDEIGARYKRHRKHLVEEYLCDIQTVWGELHRVLKPKCYCAIVIGESRKFPGTTDIALKGLCELLPAYWGPEIRNPSRRRVADRKASGSVEKIFIVQKK